MGKLSDTADLTHQLAVDRAAALRLTPVSRETLARLDAFVDLLLQWQARINLVAASTLPQLWTRHIADSAQLLALGEEARTWLDLGSGGGFPGLVIACGLADQPGCVIHLVESQQRRAAFLSEVIRNLALPAIVHCRRIEDLGAESQVAPEIITARAVAPMPKLAELIAPLMGEGTRALLLKGQDVEAELADASKSWALTYRLIPSNTSAAGRIVVLSAVKPRQARAAQEVP